MSDSGVRQNRSLLRWLIAAAFAATSWLAFSVMQFRPTSAAIVLAVAVGVVALFSTEVATAAFVLIASIPLLAANAVFGLIVLVAGLAATQYLGGDVVPVLLIVAAAFLAAVLGPVWAVPVLAGYILGWSQGALAAFVACIVLEIAGVVFGGDWSAFVFLGGTDGVIAFSKAPESLLALPWVGDALKSVNAGAFKDLMSAFSETRSIGLLLLQPAVWALAAAVSGKLRRPAGDPRQFPMSILAAVAGVAIATVGSAIARATFGIGLDSGALVAAAGGSALIAAIGAVVWDRAFRVVAPKSTQQTAAAGQRGMAAEDADVDELLRLIASAEDKIANQHTSHSVVMITDMKSFSRMTEEEGSFLTAKAVQRHRDLLLPVIETHSGKGKSTGGDGLIASFDSADHAVCAAIDMQQTLARYNTQHPREREILIRIGIADGEVVLDKGGRPFIGAALNLSARVMSLGDGGQILITRDIASSTKDRSVKSESHGEFGLKNIAQPVEVIEVLWGEGQLPCDPRTLFAPKPQAAEETPQDA